MKPAALLSIALMAAPVMAQAPATPPTKPTVAKPVTPRQPAAPRAKPAVPPKVATLEKELKAVDLEIVELKKAARDSISEMNKADAVQLGALMKKKGELEQMISNLMKAGSESGQPLIADSKGS